jgi:hypothetical protein
MIKYMIIIITILMISVSMSVTANDGGKDKWPNNRTSSRSFKKQGQPFLTHSGLNYKKLRKAHKHAQRKKNRRGGCCGAK